MKKTSAGLLLFRRAELDIQVLLGHPGGPFFRNKDEGAWSIPKGEVEGKVNTLQDLIETAKREFSEEMGLIPDDSPILELGSVDRRDGKRIYAFAMESSFEQDQFQLDGVSNEFPMEWPPRSGEIQYFPELDEARFFSIGMARKKINPSQEPFLDELLNKVK